MSLPRDTSKATVKGTGVLRTPRCAENEKKSTRKPACPRAASAARPPTRRVRPPDTSHLSPRPRPLERCGGSDCTRVKGEQKCWGARQGVAETHSRCPLGRGVPGHGQQETPTAQLGFLSANSQRALQVLRAGPARANPGTAVCIIHSRRTQRLCRRHRAHSPVCTRCVQQPQPSRPPQKRPAVDEPVGGPGVHWGAPSLLLSFVVNPNLL